MFVAQPSVTQKTITGKNFEILKQVCKFKLNATQQIQLTNSWAVGVLRYYFAFLQWNEQTLRQIDFKMRKVLVEHKAHHLQTFVNRLYLHRKQEGRGLQCILHTHEREVVSTAYYLACGGDKDLQVVAQTLCGLNAMKNVLVIAWKIVAKYNCGVTLSLAEPQMIGGQYVTCQKLTRTIKKGGWAQLREELSIKKIHGTYQK